MSYAHDHRQPALKVVQLPTIIFGGKELRPRRVCSPLRRTLSHQGERLGHGVDGPDHCRSRNGYPLQGSLACNVCFIEFQ